MDWIKVSDKLPEIGHNKDYPFSSKILLLSDGEVIYFGEFEKHPDFEEAFIDFDGDSFSEFDIIITHWMPLPPPPEK